MWNAISVSKPTGNNFGEEGSCCQGGSDAGADSQLRGPATESCNTSVLETCFFRLIPKDVQVPLVCIYCVATHPPHAVLCFMLKGM